MVDNKTLAALKSLLNNGGGGGVQSDWNQTDDTAADFIKNKPFYDIETVILEEQELVYNAEQTACVGIALAPIQDGDKLTVTFDGDVYICDVITQPQLGIAAAFGNLNLVGVPIDSGEPFFGAYTEGMILLLPLDEASHTVGIVSASAKAIPEKYLPAEQLFYFTIGDKYLYVDIECTTKATLYDLPDGLNFYVGLAGGFVIQWERPILCLSRTYAEVSGYNSVILMHRSEILELFTAEYTPETTE